MKPMPITRQLRIDLNVFNAGVERAKAAYHSTTHHPRPTDAEKATAVRAIRAGRIKTRAVADVLGVHPESVRNWLKQAAKKEGQ